MGLDYVLLNGNENFYALIGDNSRYPYTYGIHPDNLEEFKAACESLDNEEDSVVLIMKYNGCIDENYQVYEVIITLDMSAAGVKKGYNVQMLNLLTVKSVYRRNVNNVKKYRTYMSMISVYYLEYDRIMNILKIFIYIHEKSYLLVCEDLGAWYEGALEKVENENDRISLQKFYQALKSGRADFTIHISGPYFSKDNRREELVCIGKTIVMQNGSKVFGIIKSEDGYIDGGRAYYFTEAGKDSATGLLNKRASMEFSKDLLAEGSLNKRYMIVLDIDDFKNFNDNYGHIFGDDVILTFSRVLSNAVNIRGIVGRIGGDEFYILTENIDSENDLKVMLKTIAKNLYYAYDDKMEDVRVTTSMGISCYPDDGTSYDILFKKADKALYVAKEKGKNRHIIYDEAKHGAVSDDDSEALEKFKPTLKAEVSAGILADALVKLNSEGEAAIGEVLDTVRNAFDINGVVVVSADGEVLYTSGRYDENEDFSWIKQEEYCKLYDNTTIYVENNTQNVEKYSKKLYDAMSEIKISSYMHVVYPEIAKPKAFVFYSMFDVKRKWSEEDKNFLMIFSKVLLGLIYKN